MIQIQYSVEAAVWGHEFIWAGVIYNEVFPWGMKQNKHSVHANTEWSSDSETFPVSLSIIFRHFYRARVCMCVFLQHVDVEAWAFVCFKLTRVYTLFHESVGEGLICNQAHLLYMGIKAE